jgi:iron complex transport system permease protein
MGSLRGVSMNQLYLMSIAIIIGIIISLISAKMLNALQLGDNYARSMGLNFKQARNIIFISTSLLA